MLNHILQRFYTKFIHSLTRSEWPWFKNFFIKFFIWAYKVDMADALETNINNYKNFNEFFTRKLKPGIRPVIKRTNALVSPIDGRLLQSGNFNNKTLIQSKNINYDINSLIQEISPFEKGSFFNFYLSPKDYHRIHAPIDLVLMRIKYIPGYLFSVGPKSVNSRASLFCQNERVVLYCNSQFGPIILVFIAALGVGGIETPWTGIIQNPLNSNFNLNINVNKGQEIGCFHMGSSVIMLTNNNNIVPEINKPVQMGEQILIL